MDVNVDLDLVPVVVVSVVEDGAEVCDDIGTGTGTGTGTMELLVV